ncbi:MAG: phage major capsid protein [Flavobacteriales bacterium]
MENNLTPEQVVEKINEKFNEKLASMPTKSDVDGLKSDIETLKGLSEKSAEIEKAIAKFEGKLEGMSEKGFRTEKAPKSTREALTKAYKENAEKINEMVGKGQTFSLEVKALYDTTIDGDYTGNVALSTLEPGVSKIARPRIRVRDIVNMGTTGSKFVTYISQTNQTSAGWVNEAGEKISGQPSYEEVSVEVVKVAGTVKISKEMLADLSFVQSEINSDLMASVDQAIEDGIINGAVGGLTGIISVAPAFNPGTFAGAVPAANLSDVIRIAVAQIEQANFNATHVVLNPADVAALQLTKTATGEYTYPMFMMEITTIAGLTIISSTNIAAGTFLVGDFTKCNVRMREAMNLQVGYVNDDFQRNMVTILCEARLVEYVKDNDVNAFVSDSIATAIAAIDLGA